MISRVTDTKTVEHLFADWEESVIWSCLQGIMGDIYTDDLQKPQSAMAILGDFAYYVGMPSEELIRFKPDWCKKDFVIMVPQNEKWADLIRTCYRERAKQVTRYAIKKEPGIFDREHLEKLKRNLPDEYALRLIDKELYEKCQQEEWSRDFVAQYSTWELFQELGLGVMVMKGETMVCGASSFSSFNGGIEVEIVTHEAYRHQGLATVCGASLILECMDRNLYPSWDARIPWSVNLAEKFGYHFSHEYAAFEIWGY